MIAGWISRRIAVHFAVVLISFVTFITLFTEVYRYQHLKKHLSEDFEREKEYLIEFSTRSLAPILWNLDRKSAEGIADIALQNQNILEFQIFIDREKFLEVSQKSPLFEEFQNGLLDESEFQEIETPIFYHQKQVGVLSLIYSLREYQNEMKQSRFFSYTNGFLLIVIIVSIIYFYIRQRIIFPIQKIESFASQIIRGEYHHRLHIDSSDEIGALAIDLEKMRDAIQASFLKLQESNQNLEMMVAERTQDLQKINDRLQVELEKRVQLNRELSIAQKKAEQAAELKTNFLSNMSHELRTPLTGIIGFSELLLEDAKAKIETPTLVEDLEKIRSSGNYLLNLIRDILDFSKIESGKMEVYAKSFALGSFIEETVAILKPTFQNKQNRFLIDFSQAPQELEQDAQKLRQILLNLLSNANKFTESGVIHLKIESAEGNRVRFHIRDTGIGMTEEQTARLFQSFQQADPSISARFGGTGLGLAIAKAFVEMMQGTISVKSAPQKGSTFTVELPLKWTPSFALVSKQEMD